MQADDLKALRRDLGMTQTELADDLGLSRNFVSMMERGERPIERRTELAIRYLALIATPPKLGNQTD